MYKEKKRIKTDYKSQETRGDTDFDKPYEKLNCLARGLESSPLSDNSVSADSKKKVEFKTLVFYLLT